MIFVIQTNDEVAGLDIVAALNSAGIEHTIISKTHDEAAQPGTQSDIPPNAIEFIRMVRDGEHHYKDHPDEPCDCNEQAAIRFLAEYAAQYAMYGSMTVTMTRTAYGPG